MYDFLADFGEFTCIPLGCLLDPVLKLVKPNLLFRLFSVTVALVFMEDWGRELGSLARDLTE